MSKCNISEYISFEEHHDGVSVRVGPFTAYAAARKLAFGFANGVVHATDKELLLAKHTLVRKLTLEFGKLEKELAMEIENKYELTV